jgi:hypothetical protein
MTLTLQLSPETEATLRTESMRTGKRPEDLALEAVEEKFSTEGGATEELPLEVWQAKFEAFLARTPRGNPAADLSRDKIYEGRGE